MWILYYIGLGLVVSASGQNDVRLPPSITMSPGREVIIREFQNITLACKAEGTPPLTFEWRHNGKFRSILSNNSTFTLDGVSIGYLTIANATKYDDGFYQCFATNQYGTALSTKAILHDATPTYVNITVEEDRPFVIPAARANGFPTSKYNWTTTTDYNMDTNRRPYLLSQRVRDTWNGDLHFAYAVKEDELNGSIYKSTVFKAANNTSLGESYTRVTVIKSFGTPPDFPPSITYFAKKQVVNLTGHNIELKCFFSGKPLPNITWSRPRNNLPVGRHVIPDLHYKTFLRIYNITESDEGDYVCTASNTMGIASHTFNIRDEAAPLFKRVYDGPHNVNVTEGDSVTFNCSAYAKPNATVFWLRNGQPIDVNKAPTRFLFSNDLKSLTIRNVCRDCVDRERKTDLMVIQCNASNVHGYAFGQGYLNIFRVCSRTCQLNAIWSQTNNNGCFDKDFSELLELVKGNALKNQTVVADIARQLPSLTSKSEGLSPGNLNASMMIINQLADRLRDGNITLNETDIKSFLQVTSNVLQANNAASWKKLEKVDKNIATAILSIGDDFGLVTAKLNTPGHVTVSTDNLFLEAWSFEKSNLPLQIEFSKDSEWGENRGDGISISLETLKGISSESQTTLNMWGVYYRTIMDKILPGKIDSVYDVNSRILSFTIGGLKSNQTLKPPVTITLRHNQDKRMNFRRTCDFWNFNIGDWDSTGCLVASTNKTHTICSCDHLTNFAILMSRNPSYDDALSIISIVGCSISVVALILTIIVYALTWKQAKSAQATVLLNLCVALIVAYTIFMAGADKFDSNLYSMVGCKVVAVLLHYFLLAVFFIMLAEGVELLLYIIFVFHVRRTRETIMLIASAWVLPLIIVTVSLGSTELEGYGNGYACWLSMDRGLIWAFLAPVLFIIVVNLVILVVVLIWMSKKRSFLANNAKKRNEIRATLWNLSVTCPVLGLGWLFGVFSIAFDQVVFQYLFVIVNSPQGLFIFIFHALFHNKTVKEKISSVYSNYICGCRKTIDDVSNKMSSVQETTKKKDKSDLLSMVFRDNKGIEVQDSLLSSWTQTASTDDSGTLETTH